MFRNGSPARVTLAALLLSTAAVPALAQGRPVSPDAALTAEEVVVTGTRGGSYPNGIAKQARVGILGERDLVDTPISAKSFTDAFIADQIAFSSNELAARDASFLPVNSSGLTGSDGGYIRGFRSFAYESSFDGYANVMNRRMPLELLERVDILKGPITFYSGVRFFGGAGGTINYVSKKPLDAPLTRLTALYGGGSQSGGHLDASRRFGEGQAFGIRANLAWRDGETEVDGVEEENRVAHLALNWRTERFNLDVQAGDTFGRVDGYTDGFGYAPGVPILPVPDPGRFSGAVWAFGEFDYEFARAAATLELAEGWSAFANIGGSAHTEEFLNLQTTVRDTAGNATVTAYPQFGKSDWGDFWTADVGLRGTVDTGPLRHRFTLAYGYNRYFEAFRDDAATTLVTPTPVNIYDPRSFELPRPVLSGTGTYFPFFDNRGEGVVLANEVSALEERVLLTLGLRYTTIRQESYRFGGPSPGGRPLTVYDQSKWSPSVGVVVKPLKHVSVYANYLEAVERGAIAPNTAVNVGTATPPGVATQYEAGVKAEFDGFGATAAVFEIERPSAYLDPVTRVFGLFGRDRHRGAELDLFGEPVDGVRLYASLAYLDAEVTDSAGGLLDGNRPVSVPKTVVAAGVDADLPGVENLAVLANVRHVGKQFYDAQNLRSIPAYTVFDAGLRYGFEVNGTGVLARLNVNNLFDRKYYQSARFNTPPGAPRTVRASLAMEF